jgi:hypothetical protein
MLKDVVYMITISQSLKQIYNLITRNLKCVRSMWVGLRSSLRDTYFSLQVRYCDEHTSNP